MKLDMKKARSAAGTAEQAAGSTLLVRIPDTIIGQNQRNVNRERGWICENL